MWCGSRSFQKLKRKKVTNIGKVGFTLSTVKPENETVTVKLLSKKFYGTIYEKRYELGGPNF